MTPESMRESFEKAFMNEYPDFWFATKEIPYPALWAAKWALEKAAEVAMKECKWCHGLTEDKIRQLGESL